MDTGPETWIEPQDYDDLDMNMGLSSAILDLNDASLSSTTEAPSALEQLIGADMMAKMINRHQSKLEAGETAGSLDLKSANFDALQFITAVAQRLDFRIMEDMLVAVNEDLSRGPEETKQLVAAMMPRFVSAKDAIDSVAGKMRDGSGRATLHEMQQIYEQVSKSTKEFYEPLLLRQDRIERLRLTSSIITQCRPLLILPGTIRDNIAREEYEAVVANCVKAKSMIESWSSSEKEYDQDFMSTHTLSKKILVEQVRKEVDANIVQFRDTLMKQITAGNTNHDVVLRAMRFLREIDQISSKEAGNTQISCVSWHVARLCTALQDMKHDYAAKVSALRTSSTPFQAATAVASFHSLGQPTYPKSLNNEEHLFSPEDEQIATDYAQHVLHVFELRMIQLHRLAQATAEETSGLSRKMKEKSKTDLNEKYLQPTEICCSMLLEAYSMSISLSQNMYDTSSSGGTSKRNSEINRNHPMIGIINRVKRLHFAFVEVEMPESVIEKIKRLWVDLAQTCIQRFFEYIGNQIENITMSLSVAEPYPDVQARNFSYSVIEIVEFQFRFLCNLLPPSSDLPKQMYYACLNCLLLVLDTLHLINFSGARQSRESVSLLICCCNHIRDDCLQTINSLFANKFGDEKDSSIVAVQAQVTEASSLLQRLIFEELVRDAAANIHRVLETAIDSSRGEGVEVKEEMHHVVVIIGKLHHYLIYSPNLQQEMLVLLIDSTLQHFIDCLQTIPTAPVKERVLQYQLDVSFLAQFFSACLSKRSMKLMESSRKIFFGWLGILGDKAQEENADQEFRTMSKDSIHTAMSRSRMLIDCFRQTTGK